MKTIFLAAAFAAALAVTGCGGTSLFTGGPTTTPTAPSVVDSVKLDAGHTLAAADYAVIGAADTLKAAAQSGVLKGQAAATAKSYLDQADKALAAAHHFYAIGDVVTAGGFLNTAWGFLAKAKALTG